MDLNFNQCLILLVLGFILALIVCRALLTVVNRLLMGLFTLKQEITGGEGGKPPTMTQAMGMLIGGIAKSVGPAIGDMIVGKIKGGPPK